MGSSEVLVPDNLKWDQPFPVSPLAVPGKTRFA
jgi:hypothetical protein